MSDVEVLRPDLPRGRYRAVLFDFDGTLSLLREGWHRIMIALCVEELQRTGIPESTEQLTELAEDFVMALNGWPAIHQMARLAEEITARGGTAGKPAGYLAEYERRLQSVLGARTAQVMRDSSQRLRWAVPGAFDFLSVLNGRALPLYLASGTPLRFVQQEAELLHLAGFFGKAIHAPADGDTSFSKRAVIEGIVRDNNLRGDELLSFGDGVVETEEVRRVGGTAVAVASDEPPGAVNKWKRDRLVAAGADAVIADYRCRAQLLPWLFERGAS